MNGETDRNCSFYYGGIENYAGNFCPYAGDVLTAWFFCGAYAPFQRSPVGDYNGCLYLDYAWFAVDAPASFDGLSSLVNDIYPVVVLNKNFNSERKRFTALHELGHIILNFDSSVSENEEETFCNIFANEMLILESVFKHLFGEHRHDISYQELRAIQMQYGISCDALMYKAKAYGIISEQRYKTYCIQKNKNLSFKTMVEQSIYQQESSNRFNRLVYNALSNELITISKAAGLLHQSVEQVRGDLALV